MGLSSLEVELTSLLRHRADRRHIQVRSDGLVPMRDVVRVLKCEHEEIIDIVNRSAKQHGRRGGEARFEMVNDDRFGTGAWIRARHKVSLPNTSRALLQEPVDMCLVLRPPGQPPPPAGPPPPSQSFGSDDEQLEEGAAIAPSLHAVSNYHSDNESSPLDVPFIGERSLRPPLGPPSGVVSSNPLPLAAQSSQLREQLSKVTEERDALFEENATLLEENAALKRTIETLMKQQQQAIYGRREPNPIPPDCVVAAAGSQKVIARGRLNGHGVDSPTETSSHSSSLDDRPVSERHPVHNMEADAKPASPRGSNTANFEGSASSEMFAAEAGDGYGASAPGEASRLPEGWEVYSDAASRPWYWHGATGTWQYAFPE